MGTGAQAFQVLGDVAVTIDGERRTITAAKQRGALAMLLLAANRTVPSVVLIDGLWGRALPQHPDTALQIVVSRLRGSLGPAARRLVSDPSGYRIEVGAGELDLALVQSAVATGERLLHEHDADGAARVFEGALERWTTDPLHDLAAYPFCAAARLRLRELRAAIRELRNDALLDAGRHVELLETIAEWTDDEPWRERLRAQHVLALYRSGRQVDALRAYDEFRNRLVDELGVEPSADLTELHRAVLSHAAWLGARGTPLGGRIPLWTSLCLPFVGRSAEEALLFARLRDVFAGGRKMVLVDGEAGIGRTRLVLEMARCAHDDAIVLAVTANDAITNAVDAFAVALVESVLPLPDDELRGALGPGATDLARAVPALRERLPDLAAEFELDLAAPDAVAGSPTRLEKAVVGSTASLSQPAPIVLLLDDLHRAGAGFLRVLGRLLVADEGQRVLVLATSCSPSSHRSANLADLANQLEQRGALERVQLEGISESSVERLLVRLGVAQPAESAALLHRVTNGHPFFLSEILQSGDWRRSLAEPPPTVREFVRRRVGALGDPVEAILVDAAALEIAFDVEMLAEISEVPTTTTATLIDTAVGAGVLRTARKGTFTFVHEICRRALLEHLDDAARDRLQDRIVEVMTSHGVPAEVVARHRRRLAGSGIAEPTPSM